MSFCSGAEPPLTRFISGRYFPEFGIHGVFVECGAVGDPDGSVCKFFEESMGWKGFNLEPVSERYDALCRNRPSSRNLNFGLSDVSGQRALWRPAHRGGFDDGSVEHVSGRPSELRSRNHGLDETVVPMLAWTEFVACESLTHVDLMVLNADGYDASVFEKIGASAVRPDVICVALGSLGLDVLRDRLTEAGYVYDISWNGSAFFVKRDATGLFALRRAGAEPEAGSAIVDAERRFREGPLAFIHIPKCSGTSFENYLLRAFERMGQYPHCYTGAAPEGGQESLTVYARRSADSPFVFGHVSYGDFKVHFPNALFVTFLRDPVRRTISQYRSWHDPKNFHENDPHFLVATPEIKNAIWFSQRATLDEFIRSDNPIIRGGALGNVQTRLLSSYTGDSMAEHLDSARKNLERIEIVGITERFKESIELFRAVFPDAPEYELEAYAENRSRVETGAVSEELVEIIREQTTYDMALYEYALDLFERRRARQHTQSTYSLSELTRAAGERAEDSRCQNAVPRMKELEAENEFLKRRVVELSDLCSRLTGIHEDIVGSKGWRIVSAVQSVIGRLRAK